MVKGKIKNKIFGKNFLVIGGAGFIPSHLVDALLDNKANKVVVVDTLFGGKLTNLTEHLASKKFKFYKEDAADYQVVETILKMEKIDAVYNLATKSLDYSFFNPSETYMVNIRIISNLLNLQRNSLFKILIHFSSSEAYGSAEYVPMDEKHPLKPTTPYGSGKASADLMALSYVETFGLDVAILRPFNNYGPRQRESAHAGVIPLTTQRILKGESPVLDGDGTQTRDFIYVDDTVNSALDFYKYFKNVKGKVVNIAFGEEISMKKLINLICDLMGYKGKIIKNPPRLADVRRLYADTTQAKNILNFSPKISLESGLKKTIEWYSKI